MTSLNAVFVSIIVYCFYKRNLTGKQSLIAYDMNLLVKCQVELKVEIRHVR